MAINDGVEEALAAQLDSSTGKPVTQLSTDRAAHTYQTGGVLDYGDYPDRDYVDINGALTASATATLYESTDISAYDSLALDLSTITAGDNVKAYPSYNGTTYSATPLAWRNLTTDAVIAGTTGLTAAGIFALVMAAGGMKLRKVKFTYTAVTTGTVAFTGGLW